MYCTVCTVCNVNKLSGKQRLYCSRACERNGWRRNNHEKMLELRKKYRDTHKDIIKKYDDDYKKRIIKVKDSIADKLKSQHTCLKCNTTEKLEVHHIKRQDLGGARDDPNNLLVLCKQCHALWHKYFNMNYWRATG